MRQMRRYQVGLDGPVTIMLTGDPKAFGSLPSEDGIEFWAEHDDQMPVQARTFTVYGTGHEVTDGLYIGTAPRTRRGLVWHLYELHGRAED